MTIFRWGIYKGGGVWWVWNPEVPGACGPWMTFNEATSYVAKILEGRKPLHVVKHKERNA